MDESQNPILSETNLTQKPTQCRIPFIWHSRKYETARGWNKVYDTDTKGHKGTFWGDGNISGLDCGGGGSGGCCKTVYVCQNSSNCKPKTVNFTV